MSEIPYLHDVVILFGSALVVIAICHRLKVPTIVGFLLTGVIVGPHGLALIDETRHVEVFAELGVVFLLFVIGIELSIGQLRKLRRVMLVGGGIQAVATIALVATANLIFEFELRQAIYFGFVATLSSTAIVLKLYFDRRELAAPHGKISMGILLFQDVLIVPLLLLVPVLAGTVIASKSEIAIRFGGGFLAVALAFIIGRFVISHVLKLVIYTGIRELLVITVLFACMGAALLTESLGFSLALGGFLAGILISESDYRFQLLAEISPFRDVLYSMFFISIGMLLKLSFAFENAALILGLVVGVIIIKSSVVIIAVLILSYPLRIAIVTGIGLAQIGEFSFVLIRAGSTHGLLSDGHYQIAIATSVISMMITPILIHISPTLADFFDRLRGKRQESETFQAPLPGTTLKNHVIIYGYGLNAKHLVRVLTSAHIPFLIVEFNGKKVAEAKKEGLPIIYGDTTRTEILQECGIAHAAVGVLAFADPVALERSVTLSRQLNPDIYLVAVTQYFSDIERMRQCGASEVIAQEFETSIEIVTMVLTRLHIPRNIIRAQSRMLRVDGYEMLRSPAPVEGISENVIAALSEGTTDTFLLSSGCGVIGKSIRESGLRNKTGASILAIVKGNKQIPNPPADYVFETGDVLVLVGNHIEMENAFVLLENNGMDCGSAED